MTPSRSRNTVLRKVDHPASVQVWAEVHLLQAQGGSDALLFLLVTVKQQEPAAAGAQELAAGRPRRHRPVIELGNLWAADPTG